MSRLKEYRERYGLTQPAVVAEIHRLALARGDVEPGLDRRALSKHENGHKRPGPYYQQLYCELYGKTAAELGFRLALPEENGHPETVDRREFLVGAAGLVTAAAMPSAPPARLGGADIVRLRQSVTNLYQIYHQHGGAGGAYAMTTCLFDRLRSLVNGASYDQSTGRALRELTGLAAARGGWMAYDAGLHDDARRWWLEATHWGQLADAESVSVVAMASMAWEASDNRRPREAIDLAAAALRTAGRAATPRLTSVLLAREAMGHAGADDAASAHAALRRARRLADRPLQEDDPSWLDFYGPASFARHECCVALMLNDLSAAEDAARTALALNDSVAYPRDLALYLIQLADVLVQRREIDESVAVATQAAVAAADLDSGRVARGLHAVTQRLVPFRDDPGVSEFLAKASTRPARTR